MENKKLLGYKLIMKNLKGVALLICHTTTNWENNSKEYDIKYNQLAYIDKLKKAKVLDIWFEPVYEEFKVGDWITIIDVEGEGWLNNSKVKTFKLVRKPSSYIEGVFWTIGDYKDRPLGGLHATFRLATPEEIKSVTPQLPEINGNVVKLISNNETIECGTSYYPIHISISKLRKLLDCVLLSTNATLISIAINNSFNITIKEIKQIIEYVDNL